MSVRVADEERVKEVRQTLLSKLYNQDKLRDGDHAYPDETYGHLEEYVLWRLLRSTGVKEGQEYKLPLGTDDPKAFLMACIKTLMGREDPGAHLSGCWLISQWFVGAMNIESHFWFIRQPREAIRSVQGSRTQNATDLITHGHFLTLRDAFIRLRARAGAAALTGDEQHRREAAFLFAMIDIVLAALDVYILSRSFDFYPTKRTLQFQDLDEPYRRACAGMERAALQFSDEPAQLCYPLTLFYRKGSASCSDFLPVNLFHYNYSVSLIFATIAKMARRIGPSEIKLGGDGARWRWLRWQGALKSVQHREVCRPLATARGYNKARLVDGLRKGVDELREIEFEAGHFAISAGLAAHWLNLVADNAAFTKELIPHIRRNKAQALEFGFQVPSAIRQADLSAMDSGDFGGGADVTRGGQAIHPQRHRGAAKHDTETPAEAIFRKIDVVRSRFLVPLTHELAEAPIDRSEVGLWYLGKLLSLKPDQIPSQCLDSLANLLRDLVACAGKVVDAFITAQRPSSLVDFLSHMREAGLDLSKTLSNQRLSGMAELLLDGLECTYLMDVDTRASWQRAFSGFIGELPLRYIESLSFSSLLDIHAVMAHVGTTAIRGVLGARRQAALSRAIFGDFGVSAQAVLNQTSGEGFNASHLTRIRSFVTVSPSDVNALLHRYRLSVGPTAFAYACLLDRHVVQVTVVVLTYDGVSETLRHRVSRFDFQPAPSTDEFGELGSWQALVAYYRTQEEPFTGSTGALKDLQALSLRSDSLAALVRGLVGAARELNLSAPLDHIVLAPSPELAVLPWQYLFDQLNLSIGISLVPSIAWCVSAMNRYTETHHGKGINGWMPQEATPTTEHDARALVSKHMHGARLSQPTLLDQPGISLNYVFGHGRPREDGFVDSTAVAVEDDWHLVRDARIVLLLSCHCGAGADAGLRDYVGLPSFLLVRSKAVVAPAKKIPYTAAISVAEAFGTAVGRAIAGGSQGNAFKAYRQANRKDSRTTIFSYWGLPSEPVRWLNARDRSPASEPAQTIRDDI